MSEISNNIFILMLFVGFSHCKKADYFRDDYVFDDGTSFYKYNPNRVLWDEAKETCENEGAMLYYPESEEDLKKSKFVQWFKSNVDHNVSFLHIGVQVLNGSAMTIDNKTYNLPVTPFGNERDGRFRLCLLLRKTDMKTGSYRCDDDRESSPLPFICKKTKASLQWNGACNMAVLDNKNGYDYEYNSQLGKCYKLHEIPKTWSQAVEVCKAEQTTLAEVNSQEEADYLIAMVNRVPEEKVGVVCLGFKLETYGWRMSSNDEPLSESGYPMWAHTQPDGGREEPCGAMAYSGRLHDIACDRQCLFVCERDIKS